MLQKQSQSPDPSAGENSHISGYKSVSEGFHHTFPDLLIWGHADGLMPVLRPHAASPVQLENMHKNALNQTIAHWRPHRYIWPLGACSPCQRPQDYYHYLWCHKWEWPKMEYHSNLSQGILRVMAQVRRMTLQLFTEHNMHG